MPRCLGQAVGQTAATVTADTAYVPMMTFDVASVRENKTLDTHAGFTMGGRFAPHTTTLRVTNFTLENLLGMAYGVNSYQIVGAPKWPWPTLFTIDAKGDSEADAKLAALTKEQQWAEQQHMLQALLAERFQLKTHWETKEGDVFHLVVAKGGQKMGAAGSMPPSAEEVKIFGDRPIPVLRQKNVGQGYGFFANDCSMDNLASMLTSQLGRPVADMTGLTGKYDFVLKYKGRFDSDRKVDDTDPTPPMDRALQEELGLKVEAAKGPVKMLVIDHVEKPSEN